MIRKASPKVDYTSQCTIKHDGTHFSVIAFPPRSSIDGSGLAKEAVISDNAKYFSGKLTIPRRRLSPCHDHPEGGSKVNVVCQRAANPIQSSVLRVPWVLIRVEFFMCLI